MGYEHRKGRSGRRLQRYVNKHTKNRGGGRGGALNIRWGHRWAPPKGSPARIRLMPGTYTNFDGQEGDFYLYVEHWSSRTNGGFICSKQHELTDGQLNPVGGKCLGCTEYQRELEEIDQEDREQRSVNKRVLHVFNAIHQAYYHKVPSFDRDDKPIMINEYVKGEKTGKKVQKMDLEECEGRRCPMCRDKAPRVFGKKVHWSMGKRHIEQLSEAWNEIEKDCACGGKGTIDAVALECGECGHEILDLTDPDVTDAQIKRGLERKYHCEECGTNDWPLEQLECSNEGCQDPKPLSIFDVDLEVKKVRERTDTAISVVRWRQCDLDPELLEMFGKPYNFSEVFKGDPMDIQAKKLRIRNPDRKKAAKEYEKGDEGDPDYKD